MYAILNGNLYVRYVNSITGFVGWTALMSEAKTWTRKADAEQFAEGIGRVVFLSSPSWNYPR